MTAEQAVELKLRLTEEALGRERQRIARVRALHQPFRRRDNIAYCDHCSVSAGTPWRRYVLVPWPCATLHALDDQEAATLPAEVERADG